MNPQYAFQYCQKLIVFSADRQKILLAKRRAETDYNGTFAFIGGKMEITDKTILAGLKREKDEEIGSAVKLQVYSQSTHNILYTKKDGNIMILPHYLAYYVSGTIQLNKEEYSEYKWLPINEFKSFEPKIASDVDAVNWALQLAKGVSEKDFVEI